MDDLDKVDIGDGVYACLNPDKK
jgi:hypothetical protein